MDQKISIMVFEDEPLVAMFVREALEAEGFEVLLSNSPAEAEQAIETSIEAVSALVTDIRLGAGLSGWELGRLARERCSDLPVIYVSGDSAIDYSAQGVPGSTMIQKPFVAAQLVTAIAGLLNQQGGSA
ncbi:response regulator [Novosphingobium sp. Gsoil 351]|uniref:response regulator n=1 Tax=Novosphingobium sp. Gsoil 351 TaxID=2675225 RepID=UPI001E40C26E|nr:response regulator [Novosphingobium sp. Gsoil 351]